MGGGACGSETASQVSAETAPARTRDAGAGNRSGRIVLAAEGTTKRTNIGLWIVATYAAKDRVLARMKIPKPAPGNMHLPDWVTDEYREQLT